MTWTASNYRARRAALIAEMGGQCARCGATVDLEFGHTAPRDWQPRRVNRMTRLRLYHRDWLAGICRVECGGCNGDKHPGRRTDGRGGGTRKRRKGRFCS